MSEIVKKYHSQWVKDRADIERQEYLNTRVFDTIDNLFTKILKKEFSGKLLDVGCGDGSFVKVYNKKRGQQAKGIDIQSGCNFETDTLPFGDDEFDIVFMYSVIEHLYNPGNILNEVRRVLRPSGTLVMITPECSHDLNSFYTDPTHVHPYTAKSLKLLMDMYRFRKMFLGLWTVKKSHLIWKAPEGLQFLYGRLLPFSGLNRFAPSFLKGRSLTMLGCFENAKTRGEK